MSESARTSEETRPGQTQRPASAQRRRGLTSFDRPDAIGYAVAALNRLAQTPGARQARAAQARRARGVRRHQVRLPDRRHREPSVLPVGQEAGRRPRAEHQPPRRLRPDPDRGRADARRRRQRVRDRGLRPAAEEANDSCEAPVDVLKAGLDLGLPRPRRRRGPRRHRRRALHRRRRAGRRGAGQGRHGPRGRLPGARPRSAPRCRCGAPTSSSRPTCRPSPATTSRPPRWRSPSPPRCSTRWPRRTKAERSGDGFVLNGIKSAVPRGVDAELFVVGAELDGKPQLFIVESSTAGLTVETDPSMGVRAAGLVQARPQRRPGRLHQPAGRRRDLPRLRPALTPRVVRPRGRHRPGRARLRDALRQRAQGVRRADQQPPVGRVHGRQHRASSCRACAW